MAYVSRIMSKNFRKEGQPEKERIARITGISLDKVHIGVYSPGFFLGGGPEKSVEKSDPSVNENRN